VGRIEKHLLHGQVLDQIDRAPRVLVDRLGRHAPATIVDAMGGTGAMHYEIKPLIPDRRIAGTAVTILTRGGDVLYVKRALDVAGPGDVLVIDAEACKEHAVFGDRFAQFFGRRGVVGAVIDGAVRDSDGIIAQGFPVFCRSTCIPYMSSVGPGAINVAVSCGGVVVNPGDVIVGGRDGVVVVPRLDAQRVLDLADAHIAAESERAAKFEAGHSAMEVYKLDSPLARWSPGAD